MVEPKVSRSCRDSGTWTLIPFPRWQGSRCKDSRECCLLCSVDRNILRSSDHKCLEPGDMKLCWPGVRGVHSKIPQPLLASAIVDNHSRLRKSAIYCNFIVLSHVLLSWPNSSSGRHQYRRRSSPTTLVDSHLDLRSAACCDDLTSFGSKRATFGVRKRCASDRDGVCTRNCMLVRSWHSEQRKTSMNTGSKSRLYNLSNASSISPPQGWHLVNLKQYRED